MIGQVVARPPEIQHFVPRPEKRFDQVGKSLALLDALSPGEGIADDRDSVTVGAFCANLPLAEPHTVHDDARPAPAREVGASVGARTRVTKDVPDAELGGHERDGSRESRHRDSNRDSGRPRSAPSCDTPTQRDSREPRDERHVQETIVSAQPANLELASNDEQDPRSDGQREARGG